MTAEDKLIMTLALVGIEGRSTAADAAATVLAAIRAAGWLLIPPLDTPEGKAAVKRAAETLWADLEDRPDAQDFRIVARTLRAARGPQ